MVVILAGLTCLMGPIQMLKLYGIPYWVGFLILSCLYRYCNQLSGLYKLYWFQMQIFVMWLDLVTYLHHHGHEDKLPWYRGKVRDVTMTIQIAFII